MEPDHVYKLVRMVGSSESSVEDAVKNAVGRAGDSVRHMRWFKIIETRGHIDNGQVKHWQVTLEVGFTLDEA